MGLSKSDILNANKLPKEVVSVPEWGGTVTVKTLTGRERDAFEQDMVEQTKGSAKVRMVNIRAKLCARAMIGDDGNRLFSDKEVDKLGDLNCVPLDRVYEVASRLNKLSEEDIDELVEKSDEAQNEDSGSD